MSGPTKIDYSRLLGFDTVADELREGVDLKKPVIAERLQAKIGITATVIKTERPVELMPEVFGPAAPVMRGLGGRKVGTK
jgi:hypothetical protein